MRALRSCRSSCFTRRRRLPRYAALAALADQRRCGGVPALLAYGLPYLRPVSLTPLYYLPCAPSRLLLFTAGMGASSPAPVHVAQHATPQQRERWQQGSAHRPRTRSGAARQHARPGVRRLPASPRSVARYRLGRWRRAEVRSLSHRRRPYEPRRRRGALRRCAAGEACSGRCHRAAHHPMLCAQHCGKKGSGSSRSAVCCCALSAAPRHCRSRRCYRRKCVVAGLYRRAL